MQIFLFIGKNGVVECGVDVDFRRNEVSLAADLLRVAVPTDASNALSRTYYPMKTGPLVDCASEEGKSLTAPIGVQLCAVTQPV